MRLYEYVHEYGFPLTFTRTRTHGSLAKNKGHTPLFTHAKHSPTFTKVGRCRPGEPHSTAPTARTRTAIKASHHAATDRSRCIRLGLPGLSCVASGEAGTAAPHLRFAPGCRGEIKNQGPQKTGATPEWR